MAAGYKGCDINPSFYLWATEKILYILSQGKNQYYHHITDSLRNEASDALRSAVELIGPGFYDKANPVTHMGLMMCLQSQESHDASKITHLNITGWERFDVLFWRASCWRGPFISSSSHFCYCLILTAGPLRLTLSYPHRQTSCRWDIPRRLSRSSPPE